MTAEYMKSLVICQQRVDARESAVEIGTGTDPLHAKILPDVFNIVIAIANMAYNEFCVSGYTSPMSRYGLFQERAR
jgi:hypothetical protein